MKYQQFNQQFKRIKIRFGYLDDDFIIGMGKEYYRNKYLCNIKIQEFIKVIDAIIDGNYKYMLKPYEIINLHKQLYPKGYDSKCDCDNGYVILIEIAIDKEIAAPCSCNKTYKYNYQDFINTGKYKIMTQPSLTDVPEHLERVKNNPGLHKIIQQIHDKHFKDLPF